MRIVAGNLDRSEVNEPQSPLNGGNGDGDLRLLPAALCADRCAALPEVWKEIKKQTVDQMVDQIMELPERTKIQLLAPVVRGRKGEHQKLFEQAKRSGYVRVIVDGSMYELSEEIKLDKNKKHNIEIVVDRLMVKEGIEKRLADSIENVLTLANGLMTVDVIGGEPIQFSEEAFPARTAGSASARLNREVFPSTIRSARARPVSDLVIKWNSMRI